MSSLMKIVGFPKILLGVRYRLSLIFCLTLIIGDKERAGCICTHWTCVHLMWSDTGWLWTSITSNLREWFSGVKNPLIGFLNPRFLKWSIGQSSHIPIRSLRFKWKKKQLMEDPFVILTYWTRTRKQFHLHNWTNGKGHAKKNVFTCRSWSMVTRTTPFWQTHNLQNESSNSSVILQETQRISTTTKRMRQWCDLKHFKR